MCGNEQNFDNFELKVYVFLTVFTYMLAMMDFFAIEARERS